MKRATRITRVRSRDSAALALACLMVAAFLLGCDGEMLGLPHVPLAAASPDGRSLAWIRNHTTLDGPSQSIWLGPVGDTSVQLRRLGEDSDWCNTIVWSADSSTVAYLVQDARLLTADRSSRRIVSEKWLTEWQGEYPPYRMVRNLSLSADGREAHFRDCARTRHASGHERRCDDRTVTIR